jgi:hypothetical protein
MNGVAVTGVSSEDEERSIETPLRRITKSRVQDHDRVLVDVIGIHLDRFTS